MYYSVEGKNSAKYLNIPNKLDKKKNEADLSSTYTIQSPII
jgi:hypothetical protein